MTAIRSPPSDYAALTEGCGLLDRSERGKLALTGSAGQGVPPGPGEQRRRGARPGRRLLRRVAHAEGQDARRPPGPRHRRRAAARHRARRAAGAVQHDPPLPRSATTSSCTSGRSSAACCRSSGPARARCIGADGLASGRARPRARRRSAGSRPGRSAPTSGSTCCATPRTPRALRARSSGAERSRCREADAEVVRIERGRPRYGIDLDDSVIPQEAGLNERAVSFTKGCYVGQETVARLYYRGKPEPPAARPSVRARRRTAAPRSPRGRAVVGRVGSVASRRASARSHSRSSGARRRPARP